MRSRLQMCFIVVLTVILTAFPLMSQVGAQTCSTTANIAVLGDQPPANDNLVDWLISQGIPATRVFWDEEFLGDVASFDIIIFNRTTAPTQGEFVQFLADTDSSGAGVVFLSGSSGFASGIGQLWTHIGNPSVLLQAFSNVSLYKFYDVLEAHPILDGFEVGDRIRFDESDDFVFKKVTWFDGYTGAGRQVLGNAGQWFRGDRVKGPGIGAQERSNNRHALLSLHQVSVSFSPSEWNEDASRIFLNAMAWVAPADAPFDCN